MKQLLDPISQRRKNRSKMNFYAHRSFDSQKFPNFQRIIFFDRTEAIFDSDTPMDRGP